MALIKLLLRKFLRFMLTVVTASSIVFVILRLIPGDPAVVIGGISSSGQNVQAIRAELGTDKPIPVQYLTWIQSVFSFNLGKSFITGENVSTLIFQRFPVTLFLAILGILFAIVIAIPLGVVSALKRWSFWDHFGMAFSQVGIAIPEFWLAILLLLVFSVNARLFPLFGGETPVHFILPAVTLGLSRGAVLLRLVRASMIEELNKEYIITARAKGLPENVVLYRHALRNALLSVLTVSGIQFGYMLGGAIIVEQVFALPGVGRLFLSAIYQRDFPVIQGGVVFVALVFSMVNFMTDVLYSIVNPRIRVH
jgi:peptide/nickel transport system permease protein